MTQEKGSDAEVPEDSPGTAVISSARGFRASVVALSLAWASIGGSRRPLVVVWDEDGYDLLLAPAGEPVPGSVAAYGADALGGAELPTVPFRGFDLLRLDDAQTDASRLPEIQRRLERDYGPVLHVPSPSYLGMAGSASWTIARHAEHLVIVSDQGFPSIVRAVNLVRGLVAGTRAVLAVDRYNPAVPASLAEIGAVFPGIPVVSLPADSAVVFPPPTDGLLAVERPESAAYLAGIRELLAVLDAG